MLQETRARLAGVPDVGAPVVVCNESHRFLVAEQLLEARHRSRRRSCSSRSAAIPRRPSPSPRWLPSPMRRPTQATRSGAADPAGRSRDPRRRRRFRPRSRSAARPQQEGKLVTFGIVPTQARNRLRLHPPRGGPRGSAAFPIAQFVEKPDLRDARRRYVESGEYFWNSGMFMFRARRYLEELRSARAGDLRGVRAGATPRAKRDLDFTRCRREGVRARARAIRSTTP